MLIFRQTPLFIFLLLLSSMLRATTFHEVFETYLETLADEPPEYYMIPGLSIAPSVYLALLPQENLEPANATERRVPPPQLFAKRHRFAELPALFAKDGSLLLHRVKAPNRSEMMGAIVFSTDEGFLSFVGPSAGSYYWNELSAQDAAQIEQFGWPITFSAASRQGVMACENIGHVILPSANGEQWP